MSMPTLGLVGSTGRVEGPKNNSADEEKIRAPCLVAVSSIEDKDESKEMEVDNKESETSKPEDEALNRPRLTTTLLIFKRPTDESSDYVIANPANQDELEEDEDYLHYQKKKKKKKKKKSKENVVSMSRSYAEKLLDMQKSIAKLTSKYQQDQGDDRDRRRRTQSTSCVTGVGSSQSLSGLKSPPLSAPILGQLPSFAGFKGKTNLYRRRQLSTGSTIADGKRRFTRKKRWESEDTRSSGIATPTIETTKKSHLSENNVWTPMDDYRLLINMAQTKGNLEHVFAGTKFSCFYTFEDVEHRWETLLYDTKAGPLSQQAISNLHPFVKAKIKSEALFSEDEENLLRTVKIAPGGSAPDLTCFTTLLDENPEIFANRTARQLLLHWMDMKTFHLLDGQDVRDYKDPFNLFEFQDSAYLTALPDMAVLNELQTESKLVKRQIRQLEEEIESWHCMQELVVSDGSSDLHSIFSLSEFDDQTYAILRGKQVRYCMRSKEILLGRHSTNNKVDADLTLEGASGKVSRRQAVIQMGDFGEFFIINQGRHSIFVDSLHVPYGGKAKLVDGCVIQITHINLIFKINEKLMKREISHDISKEVMHMRLKNYDSISSSPANYPSVTSVLKSHGVVGPVGDTFTPPTSSRYKAPKKRSTSSANNSPMLGPSATGPLPSHPRPVGPHSAIGSIAGTSTLLPFTSGDLTIRPTSQPQSPSPFLTDINSKSPYTKPLVSDSDVFKKPAPVTANRTPSKTSTSTRVQASSALMDSVFTSAFAAVGNVQMLPSSTIYAPQKENTDQTDNNVNASTPGTNGQPATLPPASSLIDYSKLGLPDLTVTQRINPNTLVQNPLSSGEKSLPVSSQNVRQIRDDDDPPTPSLGLVKVDSASITPSTTSS